MFAPILRLGASSAGTGLTRRNGMTCTKTGRVLAPLRFFAAACVLGCAVLPLAGMAAETPPPSRPPAPVQNLIESHEGNALLPPDGIYFLGEDSRFAIVHYGELPLLRFEGDGEIFALGVERAPLGGRI